MGKKIPAKLVKPYSIKVYARRDEILKKYSSAKKECHNLVVQFLNDLKEGIRLIAFKWQNGEKKRIITFFVYVIVAIGMLFVVIWIGNNITILFDELVKCVRMWYSNLNYGIREIIDKTLALLFIMGIMLWVIFMAPKNYASKVNIIEKIKYIVGLIIFELAFGVIAGMILFAI